MIATVKRAESESAARPATKGKASRAALLSCLMAVFYTCAQFASAADSCSEGGRFIGPDAGAAANCLQIRHRIQSGISDRQVGPRCELLEQHAAQLWQGARR